MANRIKCERRLSDGGAQRPMSCRGRGQSSSNSNKRCPTTSDGHLWDPTLVKSEPTSTAVAQEHDAIRRMRQLDCDDSLKLSARSYDSDSDSDGPDSANAANTRLLMRAWLQEQIDSGDIPELCWLDPDKTMFKIPWIHASRQTFNKDTHSELYRRWAEYTGRYDPKVADAKKWKANFRCALNSLPDVVEMKGLGKKGQHAHKVYRLDKPKRRSSIVSRTKPNRTPARSRPGRSSRTRTSNTPEGPRYEVNNCVSAVPDLYHQHPSPQRASPGPNNHHRGAAVHSPNVPSAAQDRASVDNMVVGPTSPPVAVAASPGSPPDVSFHTMLQEMQTSQDHEYAFFHKASTTRHNTVIPEPVLEFGADNSNVWSEVYNSSSCRQDYALDGCCSPSSSTSDYSDHDFNAVTEYIINNKEEISVMELLAPVIYSS